jgi:hypothetical protein
LKITQSRLFDKAILGAAKAAQELAAFIDYVNGVNDNVIRALRNELTLTDNMKGQFITVELTHATASTVSITQRSIAGIVHMKTTATDGDTLQSFDWQFTSSGQLQINEKICYLLHLFFVSF